jgi:hypothetical protein
MNEYMSFKKMITPAIIQGLFWLVVAGCVISGLIQLASEPLAGILLIILGPFVARIYAELLLIMFKIHERLGDIQVLLEKNLEK